MFDHGDRIHANNGVATPVGAVVYRIGSHSGCQFIYICHVAQV